MEYFTVEEVSNIAKLSIVTIRRHIKSGKLVASKIGSVWRIEKKNLEKYLKGE